MSRCCFRKRLVRSRRFDRAAFVSLEDHRDAHAVLFALGTQLVPDYVAQGGTDPATGVQLLERVLRRDAVLLVFDNMESALPPPGDEVLATLLDAVFEPEVLDRLLALARRLNATGRTRLLFTSREALPAPFQRFHLTLDRLQRSEAIMLVGRVLAEQSGLNAWDGQADEDEQAVADLVDAVGCHARSLVLLAREVGRSGVHEATRRLHELMAALHHRYPNDRQRSLLASVELSLCRLPADVRRKLGPLGAFQGGGTGWAIALGLGLDYKQHEEIALSRHLEAVGFGTLLPVGGLTYLRLHPALAPALWQELTEAQRHDARAAWAAAMRELVDFLYEQKFEEPHLVAHLTLLELSNLVAALVLWHEATLWYEATQTQASAAAPGQSEAPPTFDEVVAMATRLEELLQNLGRPRALACVVRVRTDAAQHLGAWSHARFRAERAALERLWEVGRLSDAVTAAQTLLLQARDAGPEAYPDAAYDLALAHLLLGRMLQQSGNAEAALAPLAEAHTRFICLAETGSTNAAREASACVADSGGCLRNLGRLDAAAAAYETAIRLAEQLHNLSHVAVGKAQLGSVRLLQGDYPAALTAYTDARNTFAQIGEPAHVAIAWHNIGTVHLQAGQYEIAEGAYQESLRIRTQMGDVAGQAGTLASFGALYAAMGRLEDAVRFSLQAAELHATLGNLAAEGSARSNAAHCLITLRLYDDARRELQRALACQAPFGHAVEPWTTFAILSDLECAVGNISAATEARQQALVIY